MTNTNHMPPPQPTFAPDGERPHRPQEMVPARDAPTAAAAAPEGDQGVIDIWVDSARDTWQRLSEWFTRDSGFGREHPADLTDLFSYWWAAPMAGAMTFLRWLQRVDGLTFGLFGTFTGYAWAWLWQRPLRRVCLLLFLFVIWRFK